MELKKGDVISPSRKTRVRETVIDCDGVRVITCYERPDGRAEYFTREMRDVERFWEKTRCNGAKR